MPKFCLSPIWRKSPPISGKKFSLCRCQLRMKPRNIFHRKWAALILLISKGKSMWSGRWRLPLPAVITSSWWVRRAPEKLCWRGPCVRYCRRWLMMKPLKSPRFTASADCCRLLHQWSDKGLFAHRITPPPMSAWSAVGIFLNRVKSASVTAACFFWMNYPNSGTPYWKFSDNL